MGITIRTLTADDDFRDALRPTAHSFGDVVDDEWLEDASGFAEFDRFFSARDDNDRPVGGAASLSWKLAVPGGIVRTAAVTEVGVYSTHRRQGIARDLMRVQLQDAVDRGEPVATLYASESTIYQRFGYGPASSTVYTQLDSRHAQFAVPPSGGGSLRLATLDDATEDLRAVFDAHWSRFSGEHSRSDGLWTMMLRDREKNRRGWSAMQVLLHENESGERDGYVLFRTKDDWNDYLPNGVTQIREVVAATDEIELELLGHFFDRDLYPRIELDRRPVDDPLRWRLTDTRRVVRGTDADSIWVRIVDVPVALSSRTYDDAGTVVLDVVDEFRPESGGRFRLTVDDDGSGTCEPTSDDADLTLPVGDLGSAYLGFHGLRSVARAKRITEHTAGAISATDKMFRSATPCRNYTNF